VDLGESEDADRRREVVVEAPEASSPVPAGEAILELYRITVEMADRISARRATANSFFLTIHTVTVAFVSLLSSANEANRVQPVTADDFSVIVTAAAGAVLSCAWWLLLRSYRDLNGAKFKVINDIERGYFPIHPFKQEWEYLRRSDPVPWWRRRYAELGFVERVVPLVFLGVYVALAVRVWLS
jgi:hypothetical protein